MGWWTCCATRCRRPLGVVGCGGPRVVAGVKIDGLDPTPVALVHTPPPPPLHLPPLHLHLHLHLNSSHHYNEPQCAAIVLNSACEHCVAHLIYKPP
jgi:hypothetical protein